MGNSSLAKAPELVWLGLESVHAGDLKFALFPHWMTPRRLPASGNDFRIFNPLRVQPLEGKRFRIISGFRRFYTARFRNLKSIPCLVERNPSCRQLFKQVVIENATTRPLSELEKAVAVRKLTSEFEVAEEEVVEHFLPLLDIRADLFHLKRYRRLGLLPPEILQAVGAWLEPDVALKLAAWPLQDRTLFLELGSEYHPGRNRQKELFVLLDEIPKHLLHSGRAREICSRTRLWTELGLSSIHLERRVNSQQRLLRILARLREVRFPQVHARWKQWDSLVTRLGLPAQVRLEPPLNFEGGRLSLSFVASSPNQFRELLVDLQEAAGKQDLEELFALL